MRKISVVGCLASLGLAAGAQAGIAMSFADPIPGRQLHNQASGVESGVGLLTYDQSASFDFFVDGTDVGFGPVTFTGAHMEMRMALGTTSSALGVTIAPVVGFFTIYTLNPDLSRNTIISGTALDGAFVRVGNTNSLLFSDPDFDYTPGPALAALMPPGTSFADPTEAVFTLTSIAPVGGGSFLNDDGSFKTFDANASFTGNAEVVPAPGAIVLGGLGALTVLSRKRR